MFPYTFDYALQDGNIEFLKCWLQTPGQWGDALRVQADIYIFIYGWIATLLYRFKKKIDEKKFSILEVISSASYCTMWQENMNKFSRLPL